MSSSIPYATYSRHQHISFSITLLLFLTVSGHAQYSWEWQLPFPQGNDLRAIIYGKNRFVAVGPYGTVVTSDDGISWESQKSGGTLDLSAVACNETTFVALGRDLAKLTNYVLYSDDGITWIPVKLNSGAGNRFSAVTYGAGRFVAVGCLDQVLTSTDGKTWKINKFEHSRLLTDVAFGNGLFVAVGDDSCIYSSTDGEVWKCALADSTPYHQFIDFCNGRFYSISALGMVTSSEDGVNWSQQKVKTLEGMHYMFYDNGVYLVAGPLGRFAVSQDGNTWDVWYTENGSSHLSETYMGVVMHVAGGNGIFVAVGDYGVISTSPDGFSWTRRTIGMGNNVLSVAYGNNGYVAIGWYGRLLTSPDGKVWSESILDSTIHFNSLVRINNSFVALPTFAYEKLLDTPIYEDLSDGEYFVSPNGRDWSQHSVGPDKQVTRMTYANGLYAAVCVDGIFCRLGDASHDNH